MNPGLGPLNPLDPLELAVLIEAAEDLAKLEKDDTPLSGVVEEDGQDDEEP